MDLGRSSKSFGARLPLLRIFEPKHGPRDHLPYYVNQQLSATASAINLARFILKSKALRRIARAETGTQYLCEGARGVICSSIIHNSNKLTTL